MISIKEQLMKRNKNFIRKPTAKELKEFKKFLEENTKI